MQICPFSYEIVGINTIAFPQSHSTSNFPSPLNHEHWILNTVVLSMITLIHINPRSFDHNKSSSCKFSFSRCNKCMMQYLTTTREYFRYFVKIAYSYYGISLQNTRENSVIFKNIEIIFITFYLCLLRPRQHIQFILKLNS